MRPILFQIGDFRFYSFGLMAALALIVPGLTIVRPLVRRRGVPEEFAYELIIAAGVGGFVFARIYYLIENYATSRPTSGTPPSAAPGSCGTAASSAGSSASSAGRSCGATHWTSSPTPWRRPLAMGYAIGRIGCQLAGDGDYGKVSTLPWAMGYPHGTVPTPPGVRVQPTPIYEIIAMSFVVWILWRLATRYDKSGWWTFGWFLVLSGIERILVEFVRRNPIWFWHLTQPQWMSIASVVIGVVLIAVYGRRKAVRVGDAATRGRPEARRAVRSA